MAKKKLTKAEREEINARHEHVLANARRTWELAARAQAKLDRDAGRKADWPRPVPAYLTMKKLTKAERAEFQEQVLANAQRTRQLAEKAQAKLDAQRSRG
jgi:hypothetical protein